MHSQYSETLFLIGQYILNRNWQQIKYLKRYLPYHFLLCHANMQRYFELEPTELIELPSPRSILARKMLLYLYKRIFEFVITNLVYVQFGNLETFQLTFIFFEFAFDWKFFYYRKVSH